MGSLHADLVPARALGQSEGLGEAQAPPCASMVVSSTIVPSR